MRGLLVVGAVVVSGLVGSGLALAHKSKDNHSHCVVDGKGVEAKGKTDAARKKACAKITGAVWDEKQALPVGGATSEAPAGAPVGEAVPAK